MNYPLNYNIDCEDNDINISPHVDILGKPLYNGEKTVNPTYGELSRCYEI